MRGKNPRNWTLRIMFWMNMVLVLCLAISLISEYWDPSKFWPPAFFGLSFPFILLFNGLFIFYWIWKRDLRLIFSLILVLLSYKEIHRTISLGFWSPVPSKISGHFKIMSYNVHSFKSLDLSPSLENRNQILEVIRNENPDIIGFQEFFTRTHGDFDNLDSLQKILHKPYYYYHKVDSNNFESQGMALFSKYPITGVRLMEFYKSQTVNGIISADIHSPWGIFRIYCVHLQSIVFKKDDYAYLDQFKANINPDLHSSKRIATKLKIAFIKRAEQANTLHESILKSPYPVIVIGDFNDTPVSYAYHTVLGNLKSCFEERGAGFGRTYNGIFPNFQIDHILCDPQFKVLQFHIIERKLSDHFPVEADLTYSKNTQE